MVPGADDARMPGRGGAGAHARLRALVAPLVFSALLAIPSAAAGPLDCTNAIVSPGPQATTAVTPTDTGSQKGLIVTVSGDDRTGVYAALLVRPNQCLEGVEPPGTPTPAAPGAPDAPADAPVLLP